MTKKFTILEHLEAVAKVFPAPMYWEDRTDIILGASEAAIKAAGATKKEEFVGKTAFELYPPEIAAHIVEHNKEVIRTGNILSQEETITDLATGKIKYFMAIKAPLYGDDGNIIGVVGTSVDITPQKEAERLKIENEKQKQSLLAQEKFTTIANQVAHDIRSPLASLLMIVKSCTEIPESDRIALREAATGIGDIANNLLNRYKQNDIDLQSIPEIRQPMLVSATLLQLLADKKYEYQSLPLKFEQETNQEGQFAFIKIAPSAFKRMLSNLINNAVDAFDNKGGKIIVSLLADKEWLKVIIKDNGKGMSPAVVAQIMNNVSFTADKKDGHGIGLAQVRETLENNQGDMTISSTQGEGTIITLIFPRIEAPTWIAEEIKLNDKDIIVILDDDHSIHSAWDGHFEPILQKAPHIQLKHFTTAKDALTFLQSLSKTDKQKVFLLTDYELLKQEMNGLHIIAQSKIKRSILVTSHYTNLLIQEQAAKTGTKILPKQLASEIPIMVSSAQPTKEKAVKKIDLIIVDDDKIFMKNLVNFAFSDLKVDCYHDPQHFLDNLLMYAKDTKIVLDNQFGKGSMSGLELAKKLHARGYTQLYLLSGKEFRVNEIPSYLTVIRKDDIESIKRIA